MEFLIFDFLYDACYVYDGKTWIIDQINGHEEQIHCNTLQAELSNMFDISQPVAKFYINKWLTQQVDVHFDFTAYWEDSYFNVGNGILPIVQAVAAQTVGQDLVPVQPMELPTGLLTYMDYQYSSDTPNQNGRVYEEDAFNNATNDYVIGELDHPNGLSISSNQEKRIQDKWDSIIGGMRNQLSDVVNTLVRNQDRVINSGNTED